ncbi:LysR family transcriptional regulator [Planococcus faecalis]|uniref:Transcriptional regulator n=1 Tax=Planococcus faecalis TaxID=1598147 RepID=A0ABM6IPA3_9BACL|nr:LysR family transcriptional regulator [Planococcus faecalis]AQU78416.1 transcriptional regulator [Planococcus faecalis]OHX52388.1 transcriptional regulator [Planococcus faecalis]
MDIRLLRYFIAIAESSTFTKAAANLHIAQPSLSIAIKKLETDMGLILLDRSMREIALTKEGQILYEEAKKLVTHFEYVEKELKRLKAQGPMELSIGMIESAKFWIPKVLKSIKQEFPEVHIEIIEVLGLEDINRALNKFDIHFAITNQLISKREVKTLPIYREKFVVLLPSGHPLEAQPQISITDLNGEAFIIFKEGFQTRVDILNAFRQAGTKPNIQFEVERFETACSFVEEGLGVTFVPENYLKVSATSRYAIKPLKDPIAPRTVYLAFDTSRYLPPLVMRSMELIQEFFERVEGLGE